MSQRVSGYQRRPSDLYPTRERWVVDALADHIPLKGRKVWECAAGKGDMARSLGAVGADVFATDVEGYGDMAPFDFLSNASPADLPHVAGIITNPPYGPQGKLAEEFIARGLQRIEPLSQAFLALLLPVDFDSASTRAHLFGDCPHFAMRISLTKRIRWFDPPAPKPGEKKKNSGPSANHAWFIWFASKRQCGAQALYGPMRRAA